MKYNLLLLVLYLVFCFTSCENINTPEDNYNTSIFSVLYADSSSQRIFVYRTSRLSEQLKDGDEFISNAEVLLTDSISQNVSFRLQRDENYGKYYKNIGTLNIRSGSKYFAEIKANGNLIKAETKVPEDFSIIYPKNGEVFNSVDNEVGFNISWTKCNDSYGYFINVEFPSIIYYVNGEKWSWGGGIAEYETQDTSMSLSWKLADIQKGIWKIKVMAYDKNYYEHHFEIYDNSGVKNAYGVFGSCVVKQINIEVK